MNRTVVLQEIPESTRLAVPCCLLEGPRLGSLSSSLPSSSTSSSSSSSFRPPSTWPGLRVGTHGRADWGSALGEGGFVAFDDDIGEDGDHDHDSDEDGDHDHGDNEQASLGEGVTRLD